MSKIIFKFSGGPLDGKRVTGQRGKEKEVRRYYALTHHGRVGQRFRTASDYAIDILAQEQLKQEASHHFHEYLYEVVDRIDNGDVLVVLVQYVEPEAEKG
jgi:hypothetical protein